MQRFFIPIPALIGIFSSMLWLNDEEQPGPQLQRRSAIVSEYEPAVLTNQDTTRIKKHCPHGNPKVTVPSTYGPTIFRTYKGYVLELGVNDKIPLWVCEKVNKADTTGDATRKSRFKQDNAVSKRLQAHHDDYTNSGLARGHQAAAANRKSKQTLSDETFLTTNIAPQNGSFNSGVWKQLESTIRKQWVKSGRPVFITTGPIFYDADEEDADSADGVVEYYTIGQGGVAVPTHFYKIVLQREAASDGAWRAIGFIMPNLKREAGRQIEDYIESIDTIEARTNINFFPHLDEDADWQELEEDESELW